MMLRLKIAPERFALFCLSRLSLLQRVPYKLFSSGLLLGAAERDCDGRFRIFDEQVRVAEDGDRIEIAHINAGHAADVAETFLRRFAAIRERDECRVALFLG